MSDYSGLDYEELMYLLVQSRVHGSLESKAYPWRKPERWFEEEQGLRLLPSAFSLSQPHRYVRVVRVGCVCVCVCVYGCVWCVCMWHVGCVCGVGVCGVYLQRGI